MGSFVKTKDCPTSESLLAFAAGNADATERAEIERHLVGCEFCGAEVDLYRRFTPTGEQDVNPGPVPEPLRQLAEDLLEKKADPLYKLVAG